LDKIGEEGVKEMIEKELLRMLLQSVQPLLRVLLLKNRKIRTALCTSDEGMKGVEELRFICDNVSKLGLASATLDLDVTYSAWSKLLYWSHI
jgi:histidyl-tRNA synthetase